MRQLKFFGDELARRYGKKLQRIPIDLALGCPNRIDAYGPGCVFCAENGSRARHLQRHLDLASQVREGVDYARRRYDAEAPYIAYFQAFTSTYAPAAKLRELYEAVLAEADFKVVIIGTRPDALPPETIAYLGELAARYEVWVELGVQSANDATLAKIRRGHDFAAVSAVVPQLRAAGIHCGCHVILGLPGETRADYLDTARKLAALPFEAVKLHQLLVIRHTELARHYQLPDDPLAVTPLNEYEYAAHAAAFLRELPDHWQIMRLNADAEPEELLAPHWWMSKGEFLTFFQERFAAAVAGEGDGAFFGVPTADGSRTLYHPGFRQLFHTRGGAASEAELKFVEPTGLAARLDGTGTTRLLDIGFGLGVNAAAAVRCAERCRHGRLEVVSLEFDRRTLTAARTLYAPDSLEGQMLAALLSQGFFATEFATVQLALGDARETLPQRGAFDVVFHDAFSPDCNAELWTLDFFRELRRHLAPDGVIATYSSAYPVRGALLKLGFYVGESVPFGRKRGGTLACLSRPYGTELPAKEQGIIRQSTAGVPYRDPGLKGERQKIAAHREAVVALLRARGVPKWFRA